MSNLPTGWALKSIRDVADVVRGVTYNKRQAASQPRHGYLPILRATNINGALDVNSEMVFVPDECVKPAQRMVQWDIVVASSSGSASVVGKSAQLRTHWEGGFGAFCSVIRPTLSLNPKYIAYFVAGPGVRTAWRALAQGTNINNLKTSDLADTMVPIPPRAEQERIVAVLDEQFSRLDAGVAALERVRERLRLLRDRALLALVSATGEVQRLGDIAEIRLGRQRSPKNHVGPRLRPYLRAANVTWNGLDLRDVKLMNFSSPESSVYELQLGDVLVAEASGSASEVGKPAIWDGSIANCCFQNTLLRVRSDRFLAEYLYFVLLAHARGGTFARASRGVGIHHLSKSGLSALAVPVPTLAQQEAIVRRARSIQSAVARLLDDVEKQSARVRKLRSAVLAAAFSGSLVPQDPNDEPAAILLERIATERSLFSRDKTARNREPRTIRAEVPA